MWWEVTVYIYTVKNIVFLHNKKGTTFMNDLGAHQGPCSEMILKFELIIKSIFSCTFIHRVVI